MFVLATKAARKTTNCTIDMKFCESDAAIDIYFPPTIKGTIGKFLYYVCYSYSCVDELPHILYFTEADYSDCPVFVYFYGGYWHILRFT